MRVISDLSESVSCQIELYSHLKTHILKLEAATSCNTLSELSDFGNTFQFDP